MPLPKYTKWYYHSFVNNSLGGRTLESQTLESYNIPDQATLHFVKKDKKHISNSSSNTSLILMIIAIGAAAVLVIPIIINISPDEEQKNNKKTEKIKPNNKENKIPDKALTSKEAS